MTDAVEIIDNSGASVRVEVIPGLTLDEPKLVSLITDDGSLTEVWLNLQQATALRNALTDAVGGL